MKKQWPVVLLFSFVFFTSSYTASAQTSAASVVVPEWALPGSATHKQVPPPADFHRKTITSNIPIGVFKGQSDVGAALVPGSSGYDKKTGRYTIVSAGYNVWYQRDEFRFVWIKMSGDVSLAADIDFPDSAGYGDRKAFVMIRQNLNDDSKEAVVALHGAGLLHLAWRPEDGQQMKEVRVNNRKGLPDLVSGKTKRIGIEKHGDVFTLYAAANNEALHAAGESITLHFDQPFYVGIGFCSHLPAKTDTAILSKLILENSAGKLK